MLHELWKLFQNRIIVKKKKNTVRASLNCLLQSYQTDSWLAGISGARIILRGTRIDMRNVKQAPTTSKQSSHEIRWLYNQRVWSFRQHQFVD